MPEPPIISVLSARPDGATSLALALAARLSAEGRVLVVDLCLERPEVAPLLDLDESPNLHQLAYQSRLAAVRAVDLEAQVQWRDGMAVLSGSWLLPAQREEITNQFVDELLGNAVTRFDRLVLDLGRPRPILPALVAGGLLVWVVTPSPLGMAALDRSIAQLDALGCAWRRSAKVVLNRVSDRSWQGIERFVEREYGMEVVGQMPLAPDFWQTVELSHSLRALSVPAPERKRFVRTYGTDAWTTRQALTRLTEELLPARQSASGAAVEA
jgi:Mrp family chromosome partitioning ATPase